METGSAGLMRLSGNKLMIVASRPITTSDFSAPEIGSLVIGLMLDGLEVQRMSAQTSLDLSIAPADAPDLGPDFRKALAGLVAGKAAFIGALDKDKVAGYALLKDIYGRPAGVLRVSTPRSFHRQGVTSLWYIVLSIIITGLSSAVILTLIVDRLILGRLYRLGEEVGRIGDTRDLQARLVEEGNDEISALAATINSTLSEFEASDLGLKASLSEKGLLLHEIHHRVKNNLQVVSSLLSLQSGMAKDEGARTALRESQGRIQSMALIHETLYQKNEGGTMDLGKIGFGAYLRHLSSYLADVYLIDRSLVRIEISGGEIFLDADTAITCGLIVNELISNSLKHAFPDGRDGRVSVTIGVGQEGGVVLAVNDDGIGLPPGFDPSHTGSMGWQLISTLILQLKARLEIGKYTAGGQGTRVGFSFFPSGYPRIDKP